MTAKLLFDVSACIGMKPERAKYPKIVANTSEARVLRHETPNNIAAAVKRTNSTTLYKKKMVDERKIVQL